MSSGYYAACAGLMSRTQALDTIANNLANVSTTGFRASAAAQIAGGGSTVTVTTSMKIVDGIKSAVAQMVANNGYHVRPTAIYANPVLLDLIDREMKSRVQCGVEYR